MNIFLFPFGKQYKESSGSVQHFYLASRKLIKKIEIRQTRCWLAVISEKGYYIRWNWKCDIAIADSDLKRLLRNVCNRSIRLADSFQRMLFNSPGIERELKTLDAELSGRETRLTEIRDNLFIVLLLIFRLTRNAISWIIITLFSLWFLSALGGIKVWKKSKLASEKCSDFTKSEEKKCGLATRKAAYF